MLNDIIHVALEHSTVGIVVTYGLVHTWHYDIFNNHDD